MPNATIAELPPEVPEMAVKFVKGDIIEGPGMPFGGPIGGQDIDGEDFGADTDFCLEWFGEAGRPLLYHHGLDGHVKTTVVGRQMGFEIRDDAAWVQSQLDKSSRYYKVVKELIEKGALGYSSGAMPHLVTKTSTGHITRWPWVEISLTPTPANPNKVYAVKAVDALAHLEAIGEDVPEPLKAALKALDEWADAKATDDPGPESFDDQGARIAAEVEAFMGRAVKRFEIRATKVGRELSITNRQWLQSLDERLAALIDLRKEVRDLISRTDPEAMAAAKALDLELLMDDLRRSGVAV